MKMQRIAGKRIAFSEDLPVEEGGARDRPDVVICNRW